MTGIEWTDRTWNPATGCSKVSWGCKNCYAEVMAKRLKANGTKKYANGFEYTEHPDTIDLPLGWKKPCMVFVNSMSDFFHENATQEFQDRCMETMMYTSRHQYQILTKRPINAVRYVDHWIEVYEEWPSNVWLGTSVESGCQLGRLTSLNFVSNTVPITFASMEPLITEMPNTLSLMPGFQSLKWVIAGGESGPGHRPIKAEWVRTIRDACAKCNIPFFFKQWGGITPKSGGCELDGKEHKEWPVMPQPGRPLVEAFA